MHGDYSFQTVPFGDLKWTLGSFAFSKPICRHAPTSLKSLTIQCSGTDVIQQVYSTGIIDHISGPKDPKAGYNNLCDLSNIRNDT